MKLGLPEETRFGETRVAVASDTVKKIRAKGIEIVIGKSAVIDSRR